jgi:oxygen-independent coproporphyrinogen-3 oxidase
MHNKRSTIPSLAEMVPIETTVGSHFISNYPPFSCWSPDEIPKLEAALNRPVVSTEPLSLYLHIPFCRQRCNYCYFRVYPRRSEEEVDLYIDKVLEEAALYQDRPAVGTRPLQTVYFGGGSPSYPSEAQLERLLNGLRACTHWGELEEFTVECEPGTVSPAKFTLLKDAGVTRLSLGFQTLDDTILRQSGRDVSVRDCREAFEQARDAGFDQINIDLLAGLPGERTATWRRTIDRVLDLAPDCVTIYQLELTYNSALHRSMQTGRKPSLPDWPTKHAWTADAFETLEHAGYTVASGYMAVREPRRWRFAYTVDHFWRGEDLLALGETSFGHIQGVHYQNAHTFERYIGLLQEHQLPWRRAYGLQPEEKLRREVILQLKTGVLDAAYFRRKFQVELTERFASELAELRRREQLEIDGDSIRLTRDALLDVDWLLPLFYLPQHRGIRYT